MDENLWLYDQQTTLCILLGCEIYNHLMEDILTP